MIDIGANLTSPAFEHDLDAVLERAVAAGVEHVIVTGTDLETSAAAARLSAHHPHRLHATAGVHPHHAKSLDGDWLGRLELLALAASVCAVGETGLDFHRNYSPRDAQVAAFHAQLELAARLALPVFVHDRDSGGEVYRALAAYAAQVPRIVVHCFTGTAEDLARYLELGCSIGITGWVADERRGAGLSALVPGIPDDRLMIETDAPFLMPRNIVPRPPGRRNEPANLVWVARRLAELRGTTLAAIDALTSANAARFFNIGSDR